MPPQDLDGLAGAFIRQRAKETEVLAANDRATAIVGKYDPIAPVAITANDGNGAAIDVDHPCPAQPHVARLFLGQTRRATAAAVVMAGTVPAVATAIVMPAATVLNVNSEFRSLGSSHRSRAGKTRECNESGDTGLDDEIGHWCLQIGPELAPFELSRLPGLETHY